MTRRWSLALLALFASWATRPASAGDAWDFAVSALIGGSFPLDVNGQPYVNTETQTDIIADGVSNYKALELGGRFSVWKPRPRGLEWGIQADVTTFKADEVDGATYTYHGIDGGVPVEGTGIQVKDDARLTHFTGAFLLRWTMGARDKLKGGRWAPYVGLGGGIERVDERSGTGFVDSAPLFLGLGGVQVNLSPRLGVFGEYRYTRSRHEIVFSPTENDTLTFRDNHLLGGISIRF